MWRPFHVRKIIQYYDRLLSQKKQALSIKFLQKEFFKMCIVSRLGYVNSMFDLFESHFEKKYRAGEITPTVLNGKEICIVFLSIGNPHTRARVIKEVAIDFKQAFAQLRQKAIHFIRKNHLDPNWLKIDIVLDVDELPFFHLEQFVEQTRKNYFRFGIAFDKEFRLAFLEQEINGNAMIRSIRNGPLHFDEKNMNHYLRFNDNQHATFRKENFRNKPVYLFNTVGAFKSKDETGIISLYNGDLTNGIRKVDNLAEEVAALIKKSTYFLVDQVKPNGKFHYGYFSAFARKIATYNILRHSSSLYAMAEGYEILQDEKIIQAVEDGLDYLIKEAIVYQDNRHEKVGFVVDHANENEIKLGSNATAILAMTKFMEVTKNEKYLEIAQALARGILQMKTPDGAFIHVLQYPTFEVKEFNRIIYYEGEAIFSLLRLYALDKKQRWLDEVKHTFAYFIANDYWKYHDHWLSYAANELTLYEPEDKYFIFGLKNCHHRLHFIYHRETTYPTFLELTMAAYKMVDKLKQLNKGYLLEYIDEEFLIQTIDRRAEYQRVGFFYPELAMYKKEPGLILNGFFIRHHSFRVRIDDVEHYLSGYCQYYQYRIPKLKQYPLKEVALEV